MAEDTDEIPLLEWTYVVREDRVQMILKARSGSCPRDPDRWVYLYWQDVRVILNLYRHAVLLLCRPDRQGEEQASATGATTGWMQQLLTKVLANMSVSVGHMHVRSSPSRQSFMSTVFGHGVSMGSPRGGGLARVHSNSPHIFHSSRDNVDSARLACYVARHVVNSHVLFSGSEIL